MARMTKPQRQALESSIYDLERFLEWIRRDDLQITRVGAMSGNVCKEAGSPLQFVENTLDRIKSLHSKQFN